MSDKGDKSLDAALEALKKSQRTSAQAEAKKEEDRSSREKSGKKSSKVFSGLGVTRLTKIIGVLDVFWNQWARPVTRFLSPVTKRVWRFYRWSYAKFAHKTGADGARNFSRNRAAIVTLMLAGVTIAAPYLFFTQFVPALSRTIYDAGMLTTMKQDKLYLGRPELLDGDRNLFQVMGCRDISGCDGGDNTIYYRLRDNVIMDIKYWTTRFEPYDPAEIAGAMVSELNDCTITYYGRRVKAFGWYPYIVSASCVPV